MKMISALFLSIICLAACSNQASHLPSPIALPGAIVGTVYENATYGARRNKVKKYVTEHYQALSDEVKTGQGAHLQQAMNIAGISAEKRPQVRQELAGSNPAYFPAAATDASIEAVVVVLMVYS